MLRRRLGSANSIPGTGGSSGLLDVGGDAASPSSAGNKGFGVVGAGKTDDAVDTATALGNSGATGGANDDPLLDPSWFLSSASASSPSAPTNPLASLSASPGASTTGASARKSLGGSGGGGGGRLRTSSPSPSVSLVGDEDRTRVVGNKFG